MAVFLSRPPGGSSALKCFSGAAQDCALAGVVPKSDQLPKTDFRPRERAQPVSAASLVTRL